MGAAQWTVVIAGVGGGLTWCTYVAKLLWNFRGKWDDTNGTLALLRGDIKRLAEADRALETKIERHLDWHDRRPKW